MPCFEIGKAYRHTGGREIKIVGEVNSTMYNNCLVAEENCSIGFIPIGRDEGAAVNWVEISEEEWLKNFS